MRLCRQARSPQLRHALRQVCPWCGRPPRLHHGPTLAQHYALERVRLIAESQG